jgi:hypothetical protein
VYALAPLFAQSTPNQSNKLVIGHHRDTCVSTTALLLTMLCDFRLAENFQNNRSALLLDPDNESLLADERQLAGKVVDDPGRSAQCSSISHLFK